MNIEQIEDFAANECLKLAKNMAFANLKSDQEAATVAILMLALEKSTPELSRDTRAKLFNGDDE